MIAIKGQNEEEIAKLFQEFKAKYMAQYINFDTRLADYIEENFWEYVFSPTGPDVLMQVYAECGIEPQMGTFYNAHISRIEKLYGLDKNIVDVGSGVIPAFANQIAKKQLELKKGTITLYEPLLLDTKPKHPNMTLHKEELLPDTHIKEFDLFTGILPCEATETIIELACKQNKDFYVAMCGCTHFRDVYSMPYFAITPERYQYYVMDQAERLLKDTDKKLEIDRLPEEYGIEYPILYTKKR